MKQFHYVILAAAIIATVGNAQAGFDAAECVDTVNKFRKQSLTDQVETFQALSDDHQKWALCAMVRDSDDITLGALVESGKVNYSDQVAGPDHSLLTEAKWWAERKCGLDEFSSKCSASKTIFTTLVAQRAKLEAARVQHRSEKEAADVRVYSIPEYQ